MKTRKPTIKTKCVANAYADHAERIAEVSHPYGGCLVSVRARDCDGQQLLVNVYGCDPSVICVTPESLALIKALESLLAYDDDETPLRHDSTVVAEARATLRHVQGI